MQKRLRSPLEGLERKQVGDVESIMNQPSPHRVIIQQRLQRAVTDSLVDSYAAGYVVS
jgi:hypothetical protein